jgi:hypothetical protein
VVSENNNQILLDRFKQDKEIIVTPKAVHGDLKVPEDKVLLERSHLMPQLKNSFNNSNDITTFALIGIVGIGGVGKAQQHSVIYVSSILEFHLILNDKNTLEVIVCFKVFL